MLPIDKIRHRILPPEPPQNIIKEVVEGSTDFRIAMIVLSLFAILTIGLVVYKKLSNRSTGMFTRSEFAQQQRNEANQRIAN